MNICFLISICYNLLLFRIFLRRLLGFLPGFLKGGQCAGKGCRQVVRATALQGLLARYGETWEWYGTILGMVRNDSRNGTERFWEWYGTILGMVRNHSYPSIVWRGNGLVGGHGKKRKRGGGYTAPRARLYAAKVNAMYSIHA